MIFINSKPYENFDIKTNFDIITVSESRKIKNELAPIDISIPNYIYEFCPTEANPGGALIYKRNHLSY